MHAMEAAEEVCLQGQGLIVDLCGLCRLRVFHWLRFIGDAGAVYRASRELPLAGQDPCRAGDLDFQLHVLARHHFSQMERSLNPAGTDWDSYYARPYRTASLTRKYTASVLVDLLRNHCGGGPCVPGFCRPHSRLPEPHFDEIAPPAHN